MRPAQTSDTRGGKTRSFNRSCRQALARTPGTHFKLRFEQEVISLSHSVDGTCGRNITQRGQLEIRHHSFVVCNRDVMTEKVQVQTVCGILVRSGSITDWSFATESFVDSTEEGMTVTELPFPLGQ